MVEIIFASIIIMFASLSGVFFIWKKIGRILEKNLVFLVSFSAGVFLFITYLLTEEVFHHSGDSLHSGIIWILFGIFIFYGLFKVLPNFHHHHNECEKDHTHSSIDARRILISDGVHNIGDGILLATSFMASFGIGILTTFSIFTHEFVQEISEFFVLREAGYKTKKALWLNFLVSGTILIGAIGSLYIFKSFEALKVPLLGMAAGSFLVVVVNDLIPHSIRHSKTKILYLKHLAWFILGLALMAIVEELFGH